MLFSVVIRKDTMLYNFEIKPIIQRRMLSGWPWNKYSRPSAAGWLLIASPKHPPEVHLPPNQFSAAIGIPLEISEGLYHLSRDN